jgi:hypothetical protein
MSYRAVIKRRPPAVLFLLCLSLWGGLLFKFTNEMIMRPVTNRLAEYAPGLVLPFWVALIVMALGQTLVFWFLLRGHYWARVATFAITGIALLTMVPALPWVLSLFIDLFQMPFEGWPDTLLGAIAQVGFINPSTLSFWEAVATGIRLLHMVATIVCLLLPHVAHYCLPVQAESTGPRRPLRPLY